MGIREIYNLLKSHATKFSFSEEIELFGFKANSRGKIQILFTSDVISVDVSRGMG